MTSPVSLPLYSASRTKGLEKLGIVWNEFTPLAIKHKAINLGQGFPNWKSPEFVKSFGQKAIKSDFNQYSRSMGDPSLVSQLAGLYSERLMKRVDPMTEILVTNGATQAIYTALQALVNPGDEVIVFEPFFDIYVPGALMAGARVKYVSLKLKNGNWYFDPEELRALCTDKTRILILNSPHNPTGKVFSLKELESISGIIREFPNLVVISDEVYERMTFVDEKGSFRPHIHFASLPGMFERTLTVSSAVSSSSQRALADCLEFAQLPNYSPHGNFYEDLRVQYSRKRDLLISGLKSAGLNPIMPEGSFFVVADCSSISLPDEYIQMVENPSPEESSYISHDWALCRYLTQEIGVAGIPMSPFYHAQAPKSLVRFAFCKEDATLEEAVIRLSKLNTNKN